MFWTNGNTSEKISPTQINTIQKCVPWWIEKINSLQGSEVISPRISFFEEFLHNRLLRSNCSFQPFSLVKHLLNIHRNKCFDKWLFICCHQWPDLAWFYTAVFFLSNKISTIVQECTSGEEFTKYIHIQGIKLFISNL